MIRARECPACKTEFRIRGGAIRVPTEENELGYHEFDVCKRCARIFQEIENRQSQNNVQVQPGE